MSSVLDDLFGMTPKPQKPPAPITPTIVDALGEPINSKDSLRSTLEVNSARYDAIHKKGFDMQSAHMIKLWRDRPLIFVEDALDAKPVLWQEECLQLYVENPRLGMIASKGVGKTWLLAVIIWHFFVTTYLPKIAVLSITRDHLKSNLWAELSKLQALIPLFKLATNSGTERITLKGKELYSFIDARSFPKSADENEQANALAGLHSDNVMFAIDEAGGMPDAIIITADAALTSGDSATKRARLVCTANPERPKGILYRATKGLEPSWVTYRISGDPDDPKHSPLVQESWSRPLIEKYGRDDPFVMINVLGQYPNVTAGGLLSEEDIDAAMQRTVHEDQVAVSQTRLGVDVARDGADRTVFFKRKGLMAFEPQDFPSNLHGPELAGKIIFEVMSNKVPEHLRPERIFVDNTGGYGSSVIDSLKFNSHNVDVTPVVYSKSAQDKRFSNKRTEMYIRMRDWVLAGGCLPRNARLKEELMEVRVLFGNDVTKIEPKDMVKARIGRSPDLADALAQTFADLDEVTGVVPGSGNNSSNDSEFMRQFMGMNKSTHQSGHGQGISGASGFLNKFL